MPYRALYRKYRPGLFADIVGQPGVVRALLGEVAAGRVSHAYLFSGPRGTGKTSAAKVLARAINCQDNRAGECCGVCKPCVELLSETNMDVVEIDAASNNSVDKVREMLENVKYLPAVGKYRVYIVDEVHMLSGSAFNALLKTLEEPPEHVVFILATTEPHRLPATVLSRCQQFQFRRIPIGDAVKVLEGVLKQEGATAELQALQAIARAAEGSLRDAQSLLDQCLSLTGGRVTLPTVLELLGTADRSVYFDVAERLLSGDAAGAIEALDRFIDAGGDLRTFATDLCRHMRDLFIASYVKDAAGILDVSGDDAARIGAQAGKHSPGDMLKCLGILSEIEGSLRYAANPRILLELAMFRCCREEKADSYPALLARVERLEAALASPATRPAASVPRETIAIKPKAEPKPAPEPEPLAEDLAPPPGEQDAPPVDAPAAPLFDAGFAREQVEEPPAENLPGQMDLFATAGISAPPEAPDIQPGKLWRDVLEKLKPSLRGFAEKGRARALTGGTLLVVFDEDDRGAAEMLRGGSRLMEITAAATALARRPIEIKLDVRPRPANEKEFIEKSIAAIPKGVKIVIEKGE